MGWLPGCLDRSLNLTFPKVQPLEPFATDTHTHTLLGPSDSQPRVVKREAAGEGSVSSVRRGEGGSTAGRVRHDDYRHAVADEDVSPLTVAAS